MIIEQKSWSKENGWNDVSSEEIGGTAQLVLVFGGTSILKEETHIDKIKKWYPAASVIFCSTAGEILGTSVADDTLAVTAIYFEKTTLAFSKASITNVEESETVGKKLAESLQKENLVHAMVFSDGLNVNGTALVQGLLSVLPKNVSVTGGLVGDGANFGETLVGLNNKPAQHSIVLVGFYGDALKIGYGSLGGWDPFGVDRTITKSKGNVLFEMDGKPALALYKEYLGEQAKGLPGTGLLFPLSLHLKTDKGEAEVVRTILAVDEKNQSLTFAGDMPEGATATLMKANFDRLIDGAGNAASASIQSIGSGTTQLAILISCVGRKLVLKERVEEEVEAVQDKLGAQAILTGFYSYGELCPTAPTEKQCQLHNQTMTITTFYED